MKIIVEAHKLLQACQVAIFFEDDILKTKIKLSVTSNAFNFLDCNDSVLYEIPLSEIKVRPNSVSGFMIDKNVITFRIQIEPQVSLKLSEIGSVKYVPHVLTNHKINITCACCNSIICENVNFKRVLPLPSTEDWSYDDFFCHKHNHNEGDDEGNEEIKNKLKTVSKSDLLYGDNYSFRISTNSIANYKTVGVIHCDKCLSWIGRKTEDYVKLWNDTVILNNEKCITPLNDFNNAILCRLSNSISPMFKIVITCCVTDNSDHFILLRILNKNLTVLANSQPNNGNNESKIVNLSERRAIKVSYSYFVEKSEIVQTWLNDSFVDTLDVSKQMLFAGCNSLLESTLMIAKPYRCIDNMNVGYLALV